MKRSHPIRVLYIVYWGAGEPLGQSLVLPAVKKLADLGVKLTLLTFEKPTDLATTDEINRIRTSLYNHGVRWIPLRYHKRPKIPASAFDILHAAARGFIDDLSTPFDIIHARTYIGGLIGLILAPILRAKWVYHNEGFYPDEQVDGGVWRNGSLQHRVAKFLEQRMYAAADGIVTLSNRARQVVECLPPVQRRSTPTIVVPSCVDLEQFRWVPKQTPISTREVRLVYVGSIGGRYLFDCIARFVAIACRELPKVRLQVVTRTNPDMVATLLREGGVPDGMWSTVSLPHAAIPEELRAHDAGFSFLQKGLSEHGGSPTKVGEYWASGLPVITMPNISDTDAIIHRHRVGVIVREHSDTEYRRAARELRELLDDPELPQRCRSAAEMHYNLADACERQVELYRLVLRRVP